MIRMIIVALFIYGGLGALPAAAVDEVCGATVDATAHREYMVPADDTTSLSLQKFWGRWGSGEERWERNDGSAATCHVLYVISVEDPENVVALYVHSAVGKWPAEANRIEGRFEDNKIVFDILQGTRDAATVTYTYEVGDEDALVGHYDPKNWSSWFDIRIPRWEKPSVQVGQN